ncbi:hypothetical protein RND81_04G028400 [Saponaria officinalis]|uniref:Uncharacterized protein n=1 Tax=Saponaria officinalis TaxID=3572 RepID=A0AAW1LC93_SAPOF
MDSKKLNGVSLTLPSRPPSPPPPPPAPPPYVKSSKSNELQCLVQVPPLSKSKKRLTKQLSMCETPRDKAWEKRRRQISKQERKRNLVIDVENLTDGDFDELKGSIELGFGFDEQAGQQLCNTLPALDIYFAVNRQLSPSPVSTPHSQGSVNSLGGSSSSFDSPSNEDSWKICNPGDNPEQVKTKLRHWAQAVACSVKQSI